MMKTDYEWQVECRYIDRVADHKGRVPEMHNKRSVFLTYCEMQRNAATADGQHDAAQYIQHIIDDLA